VLSRRGEVESERTPTQRDEREGAESRQDHRQLVVHERRWAEAEQAPRRHDETLGAAGEPGQRAKRERDEPGEQPGSHRHAYRVQAADREARRGAETGGGKRADERADLGGQLRVAEDVRGGKGTGADERPLGEGGNAR
jgi:hypothetical protein